MGAAGAGWLAGTARCCCFLYSIGQLCIHLHIHRPAIDLPAWLPCCPAEPSPLYCNVLFFGLAGYKGASDLYIDANIQLALAGAKQLAEATGKQVHLLLPDEVEYQRAADM